MISEEAQPITIRRVRSSNPQAATADTAMIGPSVRPISPAAMNRLIPRPTCFPEIVATIGGAGAWKEAELSPIKKNRKASVP